jgi:hypothetical protein
MATTFPHSHNVTTSQNIRVKSTLDAIKSLAAENEKDPNTEVAIRDTALNDTSVSTTHDVDAAGPTVGSIGGVGTMEGVLITLDNKNDWGNMACLPTSPFYGSNSTIAPCGFEVRVMPLVTTTDASIYATLAI